MGTTLFRNVRSDCLLVILNPNVMLPDVGLRVCRDRAVCATAIVVLKVFAGRGKGRDFLVNTARSSRRPFEG